MTKTNWSNQQSDIFSWFQRGKGNLVVRARAGTGKTTTIIEGVSRAPEKRILLAAFNGSIAKELGARLTNPNSEAKTLHGVGNRFVRDYWQGSRIDKEGKRAWDIAGKACNSHPDAIRRDIIKLSTKLKAVLPMAKASNLREAVAVADRFGIALDEDWAPEFTVDWLAEAAIAMLEFGATYRDGQIDFDDMIWLPVRNKWARPIHDLVVIDEAQDMNRSQIMLAMSVCKKNGRICVVGDDRQAIYGFRGADSGSIDRLKGSLEARELGLNTTYRCAKIIVAAAQRLVPDFEAAESNPGGDILRVDIDKCIADAAPGDFILSRTNAPLVSACLALLRSGKRANIEGKDVGKGLCGIIRKLNKGTAAKSFTNFLARLDSWADAETEKATERGEKGLPTAARIHDQHKTIVYLCDGLTSTTELLKRIDHLFANTKGSGERVILSTVHKSKGLEADRVWLLSDTFFSLKADPPKWANSAEEDNILYVAITRAKTTLAWVSGEAE